MATGQTLLDTMEVLHPELALQSGEDDVAKGLIALNRAQDLFETHAAQYGDIFGDTVGTVTTTASQEYTTYPTGVMRIDGLDLLDSNSLPIFSLDPIKRRGGHVSQRKWPTFLTSLLGTGKPVKYWTNGTRIYWSPMPDATHSLRWYGFQAASDITASGTFAYPDAAILPFASIAVKIIRTGLDDTVQQLDEIATETFNSLLDQLTTFRRDGPVEYQYSYSHDT